jgi:hypothetical protein
VIVLVAAACSKGGGGGGAGSPATQTVALGTTGYVVDVPNGWTVESPMDGFFELEGGRPHPQIMRSPIKPQALDELVKSRCEGRTVLQKETLPGGGVLVSCKGESKMMKGVITTAFEVEIPYDDKSWSCHLETDDDPAPAIAICKSIRKKS